MMINNNPYNLPQKLSQKNGRIYTQLSSAQYRKNDSVDNSQSFTQTSGRNQNSNGMPSSLIMRKSGINLDQSTPNFRPPVYPGLKNDIKHYLPSPKNHTSSSSNLPNFSNLNQHRGSFNLGQEQKDSNSLNQLLNSTGAPSLDIKDIQQKIQILSLTIKQNEKRINQLQKNNSCGFLPNNSGILNDEPITTNNLDAINSMFVKFQLEWKDQLQVIKNNITNMRQDIKISRQSKLSDQSYFKQQTQIRQAMNFSEQLVSNVSSKLFRQLEDIKKVLEQKIVRNHQFLTNVVGRLERQINNNNNIIPPAYKSSAIRCSGSAILLRFIESFKVRKNSALTSKTGQIKITLTDNTYYIDNEGFLLDKDQHYLVDQRGNQVRLEEKHVRLLRDQKVLI